MIFRLLLLLIVVVVARSLFPGHDVPADPTPVPEAVAGPMHHAEVKAEPKKVFKVWRHSEHTDEVTGKPYKIARLTSENSLSLDYPYRGQNYGSLSVRQHPQYGLDVIVSVEKGQILCPGNDYWTCVFTIRFDDEEPERFTARKAADGSSNVMFAAYPKWALEKLRKANNITVQLLMFRSGDQVLNFKVDEPLVW